MVSGAELDFKKKLLEENAKLDPGSRMSNMKIGEQAKKQAMEHQKYSRDQLRKEKTPMPADKITEFTPKETRQLNRETGARFTE